MTHIAIIGAGITGVTTAYALARQGYCVTVFDRNRYAAMETSFANGGQLSASNAEVWNSWSTVLKGMKWMLRKDAPLLMNPKPSWHKYSWMAEFVMNIPHYEENTIATTRLAIEARKRMFEIAAEEKIDFDLEKRGILHIYRSKYGYDHAVKVNRLLEAGGLDRQAVTNEEIRSIEPALNGSFYGGFFTPSDSTGDIHKFTRGLAAAAIRHGVRFVGDADVAELKHGTGGVVVAWNKASAADARTETERFDAIVICAGIASRKFAAQLGDRVNIYPVKGYSITVNLDDAASQKSAPWVSLLDDDAKIVTSRLGAGRLRVAGTAEYNGENRDIRHDRVKPLVDWSRDLFPGVDTSNVVPWAGLRPMMPNMLPRVGAGKRSGVFYNTGHGHLGWTLSAATAEIIAGHISAAMPADAGPQGGWLAAAE
ncbi:D-amino acid dehydrogenase [Phyllobacterium myrsinacearum]|uniref:D-amino acid dehydrogenase n=1 Tax=Phyllobacterium myrsinacearum TaxID=28101 RepID=A0A2S9JIP9_9HYPH|nr:D-amino acid dehydrogenase [Phyllobacterium myrsinacearum]PRD52969.1 D-amino acid dehydrogenase [Phyllobacterium myrsinacearum]PWV94199.1 D-amino acid dehydrogenase small subunit [Phyllobacterium myrsinacearum]RZV07362.1 D-amino acid dehydrogenase small subunit [Phyllobacterium myrsinacearum]